MRLAKAHLDVGLFTTSREPMLAFARDVLGLPYEELLKTGGGAHQHRFAMRGSVLKVNHVRDTLDAAPASPIARVHIARQPDGPNAPPRAVSDPDGNAFLLVPAGRDGVSRIGIDLDVANVERARSFYVEALGCTPVGESGLQLGTTMIRLHGPEQWLIRTRAPSRAMTPMRGPGFRYLTVQVFDVVGEHAAILAAGGREGRAPVRLGDVAHISFVLDPDGTWIEISQRKSLTGSLDQASATTRRGPGRTSGGLSGVRHSAGDVHGQAASRLVSRCRRARPPPPALWPDGRMAAHDLSFWLLPGRCRFCDATTGRQLDLCDTCLADLPKNSWACTSCALPIVPPATRCGPCAASPPAFTRTIAALRYEREVTTLIADIKFHGRLSSVRVLAALLARAVRAAYVTDPLPDLLVPATPAWTRLLMRGHDQAELLARHVARELGMRTPLRLIRRQRRTRPQTGLAAAARRSNVRGAFSLRQTPDVDHVAIVDDVVTTGATVAEITALLLRGGVRRVDVWAAARTPLPPHVTAN